VYNASCPPRVNRKPVAANAANAWTRVAALQVPRMRLTDASAPACADQLRASSTCGISEMDRKVESSGATVAADRHHQGMD
jgi:hypothetical protein